MPVPESRASPTYAAPGPPSTFSETTARILDRADAARERFAIDLREGPQRKLETAIVSLELAQARFAEDQAEAGRHLEAALVLAESGLDQLRTLVASTHPPILAHLGLNAAVEALADRMPFPVALSVTEQRLPPALEESVYFFIYEALTNAASHEDRTEAAIRVSLRTELLTVEVSDDGLDGDPSGTQRTALLDRVQAFGGDLTIATPPTGGTVVRGLFSLAP